MTIPHPPASGENTADRRRNSVETAGSLVVLALGTIYLILSLRLSVGSLTVLAEGMFPRAIAVLLIVSAAASLIRRRNVRAPAVLDEDEVPDDQHFGDAWWRVPALVGCLALYVWFAPLAGHVITATLISFLVLRMLSRRPYWQVGLIAVGAGTGTYLLFTRLLGLPLPSGVLII